MSTGPGGVRSALDQAMAAASEGRGSMADIVQAGLFEDADQLTDDETGALDVPSPLSFALAALPYIASACRRRSRSRAALTFRTASAA